MEEVAVVIQSTPTLMTSIVYDLNDTTPHQVYHYDKIWFS